MWQKKKKHLILQFSCLHLSCTLIRKSGGVQCTKSPPLAKQRRRDESLIAFWATEWQVIWLQSALYWPWAIWTSLVVELCIVRYDRFLHWCTSFSYFGSDWHDALEVVWDKIYSSADMSLTGIKRWKASVLTYWTALFCPATPPLLSIDDYNCPFPVSQSSACKYSNGAYTGAPQIPNLLVIVVILVPPLSVRFCVCAYMCMHVYVCVCDARALFRQSPHKDFEYNLVWSAALEAIFCSFSTAVLEIANQGVLAAM